MKIVVNNKVLLTYDFNYVDNLQKIYPALNILMNNIGCTTPTIAPSPSVVVPTNPGGVCVSVDSIYFNSEKELKVEDIQKCLDDVKKVYLETINSLHLEERSTTEKV